MKKCQQSRLMRMAARQQFNHALAELDRALVLRVGTYRFGYITTRELAQDMGFDTYPVVNHGRHFAAGWDTIRHLLDDSPYISKLGPAGEHGCYWKLTDAGEELLESIHEYQVTQVLVEDAND